MRELRFAVLVATVSSIAQHIVEFAGKELIAIATALLG